MTGVVAAHGQVRSHGLTDPEAGRCSRWDELDDMNPWKAERVFQLVAEEDIRGTPPEAGFLCWRGGGGPG